MNTTWAFQWVQVLLHNQKKVGGLFGLISLLILPGLGKLDWGAVSIWPYLGLSLVLMSLVTIKLMDSVRTAGLIFGFSAYSLLMLLGCIGWLGWQIQAEDLLALVIVLTMMMSNLIHVITGVHREMARGSHQFDAIGEGLSLNMSPILLSNGTTILGFLVVAFFNSSFQNLAWVVVLGFVITLSALVVLLPWVLLNWLLEFRVGNTEDRHGFVFVADWLRKHPRLTWLLIIFGIFLSIVATGYVFDKIDSFGAVSSMLAVSFVLLWWVWRSFKLAMGLVVASLVAVIWSYLLIAPFYPAHLIMAIVLIVPFGIVLDDGIHFFTRLHRGKTGFYQQQEEALMRYTLSSVGRPIWNTSVVLMVGLGVMALGGNGLVQQASWVTMSGIVAITFMLIIILPSSYIRKGL